MEYAEESFNEIMCMYAELVRVAAFTSVEDYYDIEKRPLLTHTFMQRIGRPARTHYWIMAIKNHLPTMVVPDNFYTAVTQLNNEFTHYSMFSTHGHLAQLRAAKQAGEVSVPSDPNALIFHSNPNISGVFASAEAYANIESFPTENIDVAVIHRHAVAISNAIQSLLPELENAILRDTGYRVAYYTGHARRYMPTPPDRPMVDDCIFPVRYFEHSENGGVESEQRGTFAKRSDFAKYLKQMRRTSGECLVIASKAS